MENWDEVRTAYQVAKFGTVSGAAQALGVHHATVIRHVDALEVRLGVKLFQRHARGYTPTEAGQDLLTVATMADDQFSQLASRIKGRGDEVTGELVVTSLEMFSPLLVPAIADFQDQHRDLKVRLITDLRLFRLEYGEAHVAIRAGPAPDDPDNIVQHLFDLGLRLVAHRSYVERYGAFRVEEVARHRFVGTTEETPRAPYYRWLKAHVPENAICFRASTLEAARAAVEAGIGIGFAPSFEITEELVEIMEPLPEWSAKAWLVTHMDLHRTAKVQAFAKHLKAAAQDWARR